MVGRPPLRKLLQEASPTVTKESIPIGGRADPLDRRLAPPGGGYAATGGGGTLGGRRLPTVRASVPRVQPARPLCRVEARRGGRLEPMERDACR
jgi:hypothetical protein